MPLRTKYSKTISQKVKKSWEVPVLNLIKTPYTEREYDARTPLQESAWTVSLSMYTVSVSGKHLLCPRWLQVNLEKALLPMDQAIILEHCIKKNNRAGSTGIYGNQESTTGD